MFYSVCTDMLFPGIPAEQAVTRVRENGFSAYEFWGWENRDLDAIVRAQNENGVRLTVMCTTYASPVDPEQHAAFKEGLAASIAAAKKLGCDRLITQPGSERAGVSREEQTDAMIRLFRECAPVLEDSGITLLLEPLNILVDHKGCFLSRSDEAFSILDAVASPNVKLLFDIYHQQITEGNLIRNLTRNVDKVGHIHAAGNPGRHDLIGANEINYRAVFDALKEAGYPGAIGLEYAPAGDAAESLRELLKALPIG